MPTSSQVPPLQKIKVNFVTRGGPHLASYRLRCPPGAVIGGYIPADVHVFSKHWADERGLARESPCPIFDVCDDHFSGVHGEYYREMCSLCNVTCSSKALREIIFIKTGKVAHVIPEPYEGPDNAPKEPKKDPLLAWFGHAANLGELRRVVPDLGTANLLVCSNAKGCIPWSLENQWKVLALCDVVIIPQSRKWKSANRIVESLRAGRFVVAEDIPAYRGFGQWLGDISEGIEWVRSTGRIMDRITFGRRRLESFSPEVVGKMWSDYISGLVSGTSGGTSTLMSRATG